MLTTRNLAEPRNSIQSRMFHNQEKVKLNAVIRIAQTYFVNMKVVWNIDAVSLNEVP